MKFRIIFLLILSAIYAGNLDAQNNKKITITGTVLDADQKPISNAIIMIDDKNTDAVTNAEGVYKIKVKPTAVKIGVFTFGSGTSEDSIKGRTVVDFNFGVSRTSGIEVTADTPPPGEQGVNTGYGVIKQKNNLTQITSIDGTDSKYASYSNIYDLIQRECSGVQVKGHNIIIQGAQDMFGSVPPLFVIDGTYVDDISSVTPSSVKSIEVLKGTAASIYGSRGYGGVIVIKTKVTTK
jgi:TonB-dependent SusC/RagA subfamily outer membrane receptor